MFGALLIAFTPAVRDMMEKKGMPLVYKRATELWHPNAASVTHADLISAGKIALYRTAPGFDDARGVLFTTYVFPYIDGAMRDALRTEKQTSCVARAITSEARRWSSTQTDRFDVFYNTKEETRSALHEKARQLASCLVATIGAEASRLQGSEEDMAERHDHALACSTMRGKIKAMAPEMQRLWQEHYTEDKTLTQIAEETGVPVITMRRRKERFEEEVFGALYARGITEMPRVR
jgi:RNA polymerase sigma factor (sigma-70 family)